VLCWKLNRKNGNAPLREFTVDEEPETFLEAERRDVRYLELLDQGVVHTGQFQGLQFVECGMREH